MKIANARGIPGTLGCIARSLGPLGDPRTVLLTTWHTLFAGSASWQDPIWLVVETPTSRRYHQLGRTLLGKIGTVRFEDEDYFVDCGVGSCTGLSRMAGASVLSGLRALAGTDRARVGSVVTKLGAATGTTHGVIVDTAYCASASIAGRSQPAPRQLLVRSTDAARPFSDAGDSGALLVDAAGQAIGLLWGRTASGDSVGCPIGPVLHALNIRFRPFDD